MSSAVIALVDLDAKNKGRTRRRGARAPCCCAQGKEHSSAYGALPLARPACGLTEELLLCDSWGVDGGDGLEVEGTWNHGERGKQRTEAP